PAGTFLEKLNNAAAKINNKPTPIYRYTTLLKGKWAISASFIVSNVPNKAKLITSGPIIVPKEFTPPPTLTLEYPIFASAISTAKTKSTINKPINIDVYRLTSTATIIAIAPNAEKSKPYTILRLNPHFPTKSFPVKVLKIKRSKAPI